MMDQDAFQRIKQGDNTVLAEVYKQNRDSVINWITRKHRCSLEEAKDIYQDAIVIFYNNAVKGKISEINFSISSYLHEVVRRQFLSKLKKDNRMSRGFLDLVQDQSEMNEGILQKQCEWASNGSSVAPAWGSRYCISETVPLCCYTVNAFSIRLVKMLRVSILLTL
jgi:DNA-directed RNA polymerase specialized sigma24 family protein